MRQWCNPLTLDLSSIADHRGWEVRRKRWYEGITRDRNRLSPMVIVLD